MAFPTTSILDAFDRADGTLGANWTSGVWLSALGVVSNRCAAASAYCDGYWAAATYGDSEVYYTLVTDAGYEWISLRLSDAASNYDGYFADITGLATCKINRRDNGVNTQLDATITQAWSNGDGVGFEAIGSAITMYRKTGGSWASVGTRTDTAYTSGNIGLGLKNTGVADDFSGGEVVGGAPAAAAPTLRTLLGVGI